MLLNPLRPKEVARACVCFLCLRCTNHQLRVESLAVQTRHSSKVSEGSFVFLRLSLKGFFIWRRVSLVAWAHLIGQLIAKLITDLITHLITGAGHRIAAHQAELILFCG